MKVLAISGRDRDAAAALAIDGRIVAAASEEAFARIAGVGYTRTGGFPMAAAQACLDAAGCSLPEIDEFARVDAETTSLDDGVAAGSPVAGRTMRVVDAVHADAMQAAMWGGHADAVMVCSARPAAFVSFVNGRDGLRARRRLDGSPALGEAARRLASTLGLTADDPYAALDRLSQGGDAAFADALAEAMTWRTGTGVAASADRLVEIADHVAGPLRSGLSDPASLNQRVQDMRRGLAASFTTRLAEVVRDAARDLCEATDLGAVAFGGDLLANPRFRTEFRRIAGGDLAVSVIPEPSGRALGAALAGQPAPPGGLAGLALGPSFTDQEIKRTLDNCRLDYVYEPDDARLRFRVSRMLEQGKVVGWFQGALGFGPRAMGTRSILCDPSNRYSRQNMNEYLRQAPLDEPLPIVIAPSMLAACVGQAVMPPLSVIDVPVKPEWRDRLQAALDWRQSVRVHAITPAQAPELCKLLESHQERTGVPGLIETNLAGPGEPIACTPRDAVRTVYSSAIDALVIGRFVLMKDHWLLRSHGD
jgi:carbamoyltransferase